MLLKPSTSAATTALALVMLEAPYQRKDGCLLCHLDQTGGSGTAVQPFALTLKDHGISASSSGDQLRSVLDQLGDSDSDDDGISDVEELLTGGDPNSGAPPAKVVDYEYGCASVAPSKPRLDAHSWAALGAVVGAAWAYCSRRRQGSSSVDSGPSSPL